MTISRDPERVVLLHDFSEALGGASFLVQQLIGELRSIGLPVTFFGGDSGARFSRTDVEFIPLCGKALLERSKLGALTAGLYNAHARSVLHDWVRRNDTPGTIYHVHGWSKILTPGIFGALRPVAARVVLHAHDYFNGCPNGAFFNYTTEADCELVPLSGQCFRSRCDKTSHAQKLWRAGREGLRRSLAGGVAGANRTLLIHPGQAGKFLLAGWPQEKLFAVRNPVVAPCETRIPAEANRGVVFIGRISAEKGADLAARAAAAAGVSITFVGEGAEVDKIRQLNPNAVFLGRQDRSGVAHALSKARVAVMPSRWSEPFGLVALEAIGSGVPAIVSDRALIASEIVDAGFGWAIDTADVAKFAALLTAVHDNSPLVAGKSLAGHQRYRDLCHSPESWAREIVGHYRDMLDTAPAT